MMIIALIMRPCVVMMQIRHNIRPSVLVDDIMLLASGSDIFHSFVKAIDATHAYLIDLGAKLPPQEILRLRINPKCEGLS